MAIAMTSQMYGHRNGSTAARLLTALNSTWQAMVASIEASARRQEPRTAEELIEWAHHYEATQPSYAADLHAAALRYQEEHPGR